MRELGTRFSLAQKKLNMRKKLSRRKYTGLYLFQQLKDSAAPKDELSASDKTGS